MAHDDRQIQSATAVQSIHGAMTVLTKRLFVLCVGLFTLTLIALTGLANFFQEFDPRRAVSINPFDVDARANLVEQAVFSEVPAASLDLSDIARQAIRFTPIHARTYSLLAESERLRGNNEVTGELYEIALTLSKAEGLALQRTLQNALEMGDFPAALDKLDILFRRYPSAFNTFAAAIPLLLNDPEGYRLSLALLRNDPPWRGRFLSALNRDPATIGVASRLQQALNREGKTNPAEIGGTLSALIRNRDYNSAFRLFLLTQSEEDQRLGGYVFNGAFDAEPSGRPFDWTIRNSAGINMFRETRDGESTPQSSLLVRFLGKPIKRVGLFQYIFLPPGEYRLRAEVQAANLSAPKGLYFNLTCVDPRASVVRLDVPEGSYRARTLEVDFDLPDASCPLLLLDMQTDLIAESFRYAYSGFLSVSRISIDTRTS